MQSYIFRQTNNLLKLCTSISKTNNLKLVPYPTRKFQSIDDIESYNSNLSNMIDKPHLFYLSKDSLEKDLSIKLIDNYPTPKIPKDFFPDI